MTLASFGRLSPQKVTACRKFDAFISGMDIQDFILAVFLYWVCASAYAGDSHPNVAISTTKLWSSRGECSNFRILYTPATIAAKPFNVKKIKKGITGVI